MATFLLPRTALLAAVFLSCAAGQSAPAAKQLLRPAGSYAVGRIAYDWIDKSRPSAFAKTPGAHRELTVYVWYPANQRKDAGKPADYLPGASALDQNVSGKEMREFWGELWPLIAARNVWSETLEQPPIASGNMRFPVITFSPGLGVPVTAYTTLLQEVVSRGYVVISIEPTYEAPAVVFPDGRIVAGLPEATGRHLPSPPGENREQFLARMHKFDEPHINRWAADVRFSLDQIDQLNRGPVAAAPFAGRLDLRNIAAWGHSFGGRAAARACQLDKRLKACLNADGLGADGPIFVFAGEALPSEPFLWMEVHHEPPTDAQLAPYGTTRKEWDKNHQVQLVTNEQQLRACPGGSFHVLVNTEGIDHSSFTDQPFLNSSSEKDTAQAALALRTISDYTIAFFDRQLKQKRNTLLDEKTPQNGRVTVERFGF